MRKGDMKLKTAQRKAKEGLFEFMYDSKIGSNEIRYQTPSGKWKTKHIDLW